MNKFLRVLMDQAGGEGGEGGGAGGGAGGEGGGASGAWYDSFQDVGVKDWLKSYNDAYPNPEAVAQKAYNLERFVGAEKSGRGVITPKKDAPAQEWQEFYRKVGGVPEKPDGYKLPEEFASDAMAANFREYAHKNAMPPMFFEAAMNWYKEAVGGQAAKNIADFEAQADKDITDLKTEWSGTEYDKNVELGRRAAKAFLPHETADELKTAISKIEGALGTKFTLKMWANIGAAMGEHDFLSSDGGSTGFSGMTKEAARSRIAALKADRDFAARLGNGDSSARQEWDQLHKVGYGE